MCDDLLECEQTKNDFYLKQPTKFYVIFERILNGNLRQEPENEI